MQITGAATAAANDGTGTLGLMASVRSGAMEELIRVAAFLIMIGLCLDVYGAGKILAQGGDGPLGIVVLSTFVNLLAACLLTLFRPLLTARR